MFLLDLIGEGKYQKAAKKCGNGNEDPNPSAPFLYLVFVTVPQDTFSLFHSLEKLYYRLICYICLNFDRTVWLLNL